MDKIKCPKLEKCPIFINNVLHNELLGQTYRNLYCETSDAMYKTCKRFIFAEKYGKSPSVHILPNSSLSVEEIAKTIE